MYWTLELASKLEDAPWPATKEELIDYATRSGAPLEVLERSASLLGCELELLFEPDLETVKDQMMVCAFRTEGLTEGDMKEVARFKQVVLEYMKMQKMLEK